MVRFPVRFSIRVGVLLLAGAMAAGCSVDRTSLGVTNGHPTRGSAAGDNGGNGAGGDMSAPNDGPLGAGGNGTGGAVAGGAAGDPMMGTGGAGDEIPDAGGSGGIGIGGMRAGVGGAPTGDGGGSGDNAGAGGGGGFDGVSILSIDFVGGFNADGAVAGAPGGIPVTPGPTTMPTDVAGFKPAAHWNSAPGPVGALSSLILSDGTVAGAAVTWNSSPSTTRSGVWRLGFIDATPDAIMMDGYLDPPSTSRPAQIAVANLPAAIAARGYDVYVYCMGAISSATQTRSYDYQIGELRASASQTGPVLPIFLGYQLATPSSPSGNVVVFHDVAGPAFTLIATPGTGSSARAPVNGIQIVSPPGS